MNETPHTSNPTSPHDGPFSQDFTAHSGRLCHAEWQVEPQSWRITDADSGEWMGDWWGMHLPTDDAHAYPPPEQVEGPPTFAPEHPVRPYEP